MEIVRHGKNLAYYNAIYRKFVMDHELMSRQHNEFGVRGLQMLRRLVVNAHVLELLSFWEEDRKSPNQSLSLPGAIHRLEAELPVFQGLLAFPLGSGQRTYDEAAKKLKTIISLVLKGPRLKRVSNYRNKYVAHKLSRTSAEKSGELPTPIYEDIDRLFLYSMVALRELSRSIYPLNSTPEDWLREARHAETLMLKAWNKNLGLPVPPPGHQE